MTAQTYVVEVNPRSVRDMTVDVPTLLGAHIRKTFRIENVLDVPVRATVTLGDVVTVRLERMAPVRVEHAPGGRFFDLVA